jgi:hypothetical protein
MKLSRVRGGVNLWLVSARRPRELSDTFAIPNDRKPRTAGRDGSRYPEPALTRDRSDASEGQSDTSFTAHETLA